MDGGGGVGWDHLLIIIYLKYKNCIKPRMPWGQRYK